MHFHWVIGRDKYGNCLLMMQAKVNYWQVIASVIWICSTVVPIFWAITIFNTTRNKAKIPYIQCTWNSVKYFAISTLLKLFKRFGFGSGSFCNLCEIRIPLPWKVLSNDVTNNCLTLPVTPGKFGRSKMFPAKRKLQF